MREFTQMRSLLIADSVALHLDVKVVVVNMSVKYIVDSDMSIASYSIHIQYIHPFFSAFTCNIDFTKLMS